jgi:hypothetical protein
LTACCNGASCRPAVRAHIRKNYVGDLHLLRYERLFSTMISEG